MENKVLECVDVLKEDGCITTMYQAKALETIRQALTTKSKKEQAFDIANEKCVDMYRLKSVDNVVLYNKWTEFDEYWLTEEEYEILKEVL